MSAGQAEPVSAWLGRGAHRPILPIPSQHSGVGHGQRTGQPAAVVSRCLYPAAAGQSIFRDWLAVVALSQQAQSQRINRGCQQTHAPVAENKLAQVWVVAAELPTGILSLDCQRERGTGRTSVADRIVPIVQAAVPWMEGLRSSWHVFVSNQQGIAQAIRDLHKSDTLDGPEGAVLKNGFAARKLNRVIKARRSCAHRVIAYRT